jgi:hypothetical protein
MRNTESGSAVVLVTALAGASEAGFGPAVFFGGGFFAAVFFGAAALGAAAAAVVRTALVAMIPLPYRPRQILTRPSRV